MRKLLGLIVVGTAACLPLSGCGVGETSEGVETTPKIAGRVAPNDKVFNVRIKGNRYLPKRLEVPAGSTVVWTNEDDVEHTVTPSNLDFDSGDLGKGKRFRRVFRAAGRISYLCRNHYSQSGQLVVQ
jgi:plastocyanin